MKVQDPPEEMNNGEVHISLTITDPTTSLGIVTTLTEFDSEKSFVTEELAEHIDWEYGINAEDHDIEVVE